MHLRGRGCESGGQVRLAAFALVAIVGGLLYWHSHKATEAHSVVSTPAAPTERVAAPHPLPRLKPSLANVTREPVMLARTTVRLPDERQFLFEQRQSWLKEWDAWV